MLSGGAVVGAVAHGKQARGGLLTPAHSFATARWYSPVPGRFRLGCPAPRRAPRRHGPHRRRLVALTFDDGPSSFTPRVLRSLRRRRANATFFVLGMNIAGRQSTLRRAVADGDELGDHSWSHPPLPSRWELRRTRDALTHATGRPPCVFRPPYGMIDRRLVRSAAGLGMTTVRWDVDTADYLRLPPKAIARLVLSDIRPGSIVLMHDGGGVRARTVRALPRILRGLRRRGYAPTTVSRLLAR
ncbi:MAG: polysaccharide deacetylase family protein [Thermoleophilaceae bacterium]